MTSAGSGPAPEKLELRVHGVHGTSPASMLGLTKHQVEQVAGDGVTGVFRARPDVRLPARDLDGLPVSVEAYSWGALTSGARGVLGWVKRALWLLLLPFALANLSYWARLHLAESTPVARWGARATRLGALLLTVFMILTSSVVAVDLLGWQCYRGGSPSCALPGTLDFVAGLTAAQRLAVGSLLPLGVVAMLYVLSRTTLARYEECEADGGAVPGHDALRHPSMWSGAARTRQLQQVHLAVAMAVVVGFSGLHVVHTQQEGTPWLAVVTIGAAALLALVATSWLLVIHPDDVDYFSDHVSPIVAWRRRAPEWLQTWVREQLPLCAAWAMVGVVAAHELVLATAVGGLDETRDFTGHSIWFISVFVLLTAVHLSIFTGGRMDGWWAFGVVVVVFLLGLLALALNLRLPNLRPGPTPWVAGAAGLAGLFLLLARWHYRQGRVHADKAWNGAGASVLLAAAAWVALLFTTGLVTMSANYLNGSDHGVSDLVSRSSAKARAEAEAYPVDPDASRRYGVAGSVTASDAIVEQREGSVVVRSGTVEMKRLSQPPETGSGQPGLARALNSTRVTDAILVLDQGRLTLEDTCVRRPGSEDATCSAEDSDFVPAGSLPVASGVVLVDAGAGPVKLTVTDPPRLPLVVPQVLIWSPLVQLAWLVVVGLVVAWVVLVRLRRTRRDIRDRLVADAVIPDRDRPACEKARRTAALMHRAERLLDLVGVVTSVLALVLIAASASGRPPWELPRVTLWSGGPVWDLGGTARELATFSMWVVAAMGLGLIYLASQLRKSEGARRGVGVLWDLTTFWPRAAHPLAPPCYAERVVPELLTRVRWALDGPPGSPTPQNTVVLSGHSQGSTITVAVMSRLSRERVARTRVITYGSQIRALYGRIFPAVLGPEVIGYPPTPGPTLLGRAFPDAGPAPADPPAPAAYQPPAPDPSLTDDEWAAQPLFDRVYLAGSSWVNLFRRTDPLGFRVFSDLDIAPDHVVPEVPAAPRGDPGPTVETHGGYQHSGGYRGLVAAWTGEPIVPDAAGTLDVPALPQP